MNKILEEFREHENFNMIENLSIGQRVCVCDKFSTYKFFWTVSQMNENEVTFDISVGDLNLGQVSLFNSLINERFSIDEAKRIQIIKGGWNENIFYINFMFNFYNIYSYVNYIIKFRIKFW